jgi:hypothetical protein
MKISVTQRHLDAGRRKHCDACPVALALREQTGHDWRVGQVYASLGWHLVDLPRAVVDCMARYDAGKPVGPFEFEFPAGTTLLPPA